MDDTCVKRIEEITNLLDDCNNNIDQFLEPQPEKSQKFKAFTKFLYNKALALQNGERISSKALPKLLTKNFDEEQIWQQLELENNDAIKYFDRKLSEFSEYISVSGDDATHTGDGQENSVDVVSDVDENEENEGYAFDDDDSEMDEEQDSRFQKQESIEAVYNKSRMLKGESEVDDRFFKLSEMEEFLKREDLREERGGLSSDEESEEINLFEDIASDDIESMNSGDENEDDDRPEVSQKIKKSARDVMYDGFFDPPMSENESGAPVSKGGDDDDDDGSELGNEAQKEYDTRDYESGGGGDDDDDDINSEFSDGKESNKAKNLFSDDDDDETSDKEQTSHPKTPFEKQQEKERKRIQEMEESLLRPKPWQLTGEVTASSRPQNSLLHQPTTFDSNVRQDLVTTDELTAKVEDIVRMAIANKAWNDVERKVKPVQESITPFKKPMELEQTKSKKGLAEVYEEEYLKAQGKVNNKEEEEDPKHTEIRKLMDELVPELNALFAYIPKPPVPEIKVVSNLPAITVEEVAPVAMSDATLLAPEEIKKRMSGEIRGQTERTVTDKKRERRKKKEFQKVRQKQIEEKMRELAATSPALAKQHEKLQALKKLKQARNARVVSSKETEKVKSSKDFFSRLDEVTKSKLIQKSKQKRSSNTVSSVKFKKRKTS